MIHIYGYLYLYNWLIRSYPTQRSQSSGQFAHLPSHIDRNNQLYVSRHNIDNLELNSVLFAVRLKTGAPRYQQGSPIIPELGSSLWSASALTLIQFAYTTTQTVVMSIDVNAGSPIQLCRPLGTPANRNTLFTSK